MTLGSLIRFPFRLTFDTSRFGEALPRGAVGISLLLALPFGISLLRTASRATAVLILASIGYLLLLFYTMQYGRLYVAIYPLVTVIGAGTLFSLMSPRWPRLAPIVLFSVVILQPFVYSLQFWNIPERLPLLYSLGLEHRDSFLSRALPGYPAVQYPNSVSQPGETILGADSESLRYYLRPQLDTLAVSTLESRSRILIGLKPDTELAATMKRLGFNFVIAPRRAIENPPPWLPFLNANFLELNASLVFQDADALVYRVR
jgi:hypothetical protein